MLYVDVDWLEADERKNSQGRALVQRYYTRDIENPEPQSQQVCRVDVMACEVRASEVELVEPCVEASVFGNRVRLSRSLCEHGLLGSVLEDEKWRGLFGACQTSPATVEHPKPLAGRFHVFDKTAVEEYVSPVKSGRTSPPAVISLLPETSMIRLKRNMSGYSRVDDAFKPHGSHSGVSSDVTPAYLSVACSIMDALFSKVCTQKIRGAPLIDLIEHIRHGQDRPIMVCIVGGAVRDVIRQCELKDVSDIDLAVACSYDELKQFVKAFFSMRGCALDDESLGCDEKRMRYGMVKIKKSGASDADDIDLGLFKAVNLRALSAKLGDFGTDYSFCQSFEMDSLSRDYTINSIYVDVCNFTIYDPCSFLSQSAVYGSNGSKSVCAQSVLKSVALDCIEQLGNPSSERVQPWNCLPMLETHLPDLRSYCQSVFTLDYGGHFRLFKELKKYSSTHPIFADAHTYDSVCKTIIRVSACLKKVTERKENDDDASAWRSLGESLGVQDVDNKDDIATSTHRWIGKLCSKLFAGEHILSRDVVEAEIKGWIQREGRIWVASSNRVPARPARASSVWKTVFSNLIPFAECIVLKLRESRKRKRTGLGDEDEMKRRWRVNLKPFAALSFPGSVRTVLSGILKDADSPYVHL
jgi:hypothetical protein